MTVFQGFLLGLVQGATEFLPISSSGHLVLVPWLFKWEIDPQAAFIYDVLVQWGTTAAVITYFWRDIKDLTKAALWGLRDRQPFRDANARLAWLILLASLPAAFSGLVLKKLVVESFASPRAVSGFLVITGMILFSSERIGKMQKSVKALTWLDSLWVGLWQVLSLFPGISRSGATIAGGLARGLRRPDAARFSFLMAIPVMLGAGGIAILDLVNSAEPINQITPLLAGFLSSALVGYLSIRWLLGYLQRRPLLIFAWYCLTAGLLGLVLSAFRA